MPYFHATAVFEAKGTSLEDADRSAAALFKSLRHNRIHYHEHDVTTGAGPYPSSKALYFSVIAEFDVEGSTEEKVGELTEEVLEALATDEVQLIAFGLTQGEQRARAAERAPQEEAEPERRQETQAENGEADERRGKKRGVRGRGRKRKGEREAESEREERLDVVTEREDEPREAAAEEAEEAPPPLREAAAPPVAPVATDDAEQRVPPVAQTYVTEEEPPLPPPRSSAAMRVTVSVSFRASEFELPANGTGSPDQDEFLARAIAEARARHPELPAEVSPTHEIVVQPWGETVLTLTWEYDVPVPSASEGA